ncbi:MAG: SUMF1/EgtB/PvdO family nonheme iron enzyme [Magnetococcus sp. DMHC-1]
MHTIVFYSYKGGVGRSMALANLARYLAREGKKVFIMDFDLEAPGLYYKFKNQLQQPLTGGVVDLLHGFLINQELLWEKIPALVLEPRLADATIGTETHAGRIHMLAAGNSEKTDYWKHLAMLSWHDMFYGEDPWGIGFFLELKEKIAEQFQPDYLLIDARTGITEVGGVAISILADTVVCLFAHNNENLLGTRAVMRGIKMVERPVDTLPIAMIPVVTRIPQKAILEEDRWTENMREFFNEPADMLEATLNVQQVHVLHSLPALEVDESLLVSNKGMDDTALFADYQTLFKTLLKISSKTVLRVESSAGHAPLRWLHLSDLHLGAPERSLWWQVHQEFKSSLLERVRIAGVPDLILLTGDLTWRGQPEEFQFVDGFLKELLGWLRGSGRMDQDPLVIPVPGNHDLVRPQGLAAFPYAILNNFGKGRDDSYIAQLLDTLWEKRDAAFFNPLFVNYQNWLERSILPGLAQRKGCVYWRSHFPGDLLVKIVLPGRMPLVVVGLNSAWMACLEGDSHGRLEVAAEQLQALLLAGTTGRSTSLRILEEHPALLMMHHPLDWLSRDAQSRFKESVYTPERFLALLCGHRHAHHTWSIAESGGKPRFYLQASSLFGLEHFGTARESRSMGYTWGEVHPDGQIRIWPLQRVVTGGGNAFFMHDTSFGPEQAEGIRIRSPEKVSESNNSATRATVDLRPWLQSLLERTSRIEIRGIGSGAGRSQDAGWYNVEQLYTPLRSRGEVREGQFLEQGDSASLASLLPQSRRLLIEGQPGAGKTTFLRLVAAMLAKDLLGISHPAGGSWRGRYLGMDEKEEPRYPLFLRLSELAVLLTKDDTVSQLRHGCDRLLDLLDLTFTAKKDADWRHHWTTLLEEGKVFLLLDGLDEVADEEIRKRVIAIVQDAVQQWKECPMVVSSRPFGVKQMRGLGFSHAVIEPFSQTEIREFITRWSAALHERSAGRPEQSVAQDHHTILLQTILEKPAIRRLAANPVMLTCLCVVHWNEGKLPEGRARVYQAVMRWLIAARTIMRKNAGYQDRFALEAFSDLALAMMKGGKGGKQAVFDFQEGAEVVEPRVQRHFPQLTSKSERLQFGRSWLGFECLGSGIVEEVGPQKLKFWHLTFQEYLAAQALAWMGDGENSPDDYWPIIKDRLDNPQWRETVELFSGALFDEGGARRVDQLLQRVLLSRSKDSTLAENARMAGIMGRLLQPMTAYEYKTPVEIEDVYRKVLERSMEIFTLEGAKKVSIEARMEAAKALGQGGDPRLKQDNLLPVPGTGWKLGKYPVTVAEYQLFMEQGEGYRQEKWWDKKGWKLRMEYMWEEPGAWEHHVQYPNRPVIDVTWFEAMAYCRWLSDLTEKNICLPDEKVWEIAATRRDGGIYPWGDAKPTPEHANFGGNINVPTPVGLYPLGEGPYGHSDLVGNVWEWSRSFYYHERNVYGLLLDPIVHEGDKMVLRGGSWVDPSDCLRSDFRGCDPATKRIGNVGFRIAAKES